jgi:predicted nucleic acid-binding protein
MKFLLDVNALIAYGFRPHDFHDRVGLWMRSSRKATFLTCSITEIGFVRILGNARAFGMDVAEARTLMLDLKSRAIMPLSFIADGDDLGMLPGWVNSPSQVTDGHLLQLAATHNAQLATLDKGIPGAFLIR